MHARPTLSLALPLALAITALATAPAHAARPKPPLCGAGRFVVDPAASPLVPGGASMPDALILAEDGTLALESGCPAVAAKQKASSKGNELSARWTKKRGLCSGLERKAKLSAAFGADCATLAGTFKSRGFATPFTAARSAGLDVEVDEARRVSETVGPEGGELVATGADGTLYRLSVPPGALDAAVPIALTPVTAILSLPLSGGLLAAAAFGPDGLALRIPALLEIELPARLHPTRTAAFGFEGGSEAVSRRLALPRSPQAIRIAVPHFSGAGVGQGEEGELEGPPEPPPSAAWLDAEAGVELAWESSCTPECDPEALATSTAPILRQLFDTDVRPMLEDAVQDPGKIEAAFAILADWEAWAVLLGLLTTSPYPPDDPLADEGSLGRVLLLGALSNGLDHYDELCVGEQTLDPYYGHMIDILLWGYLTVWTAADVELLGDALCLQESIESPYASGLSLGPGESVPLEIRAGWLIRGGPVRDDPPSTVRVEAEDPQCITVSDAFGATTGGVFQTQVTSTGACVGSETNLVVTASALVPYPTPIATLEVPAFFCSTVPCED